MSSDVSGWLHSTLANVAKDKDLHVLANVRDAQHCHRVVKSGVSKRATVLVAVVPVVSN